MITDTLLQNVAKALNSESHTVPTYLAVTVATDFTATPTSTDIGTEVGSREALTSSRIDAVTSYTAIRSGAVVTPGGDILTGMGLFSASTGGDLEITVPLPDVSHTDAFDIEFNVELTVGRR